MLPPLSSTIPLCCRAQSPRPQATPAFPDVWALAISLPLASPHLELPGIPFNYHLLPPVLSLCRPCSHCSGGWHWGRPRSSSTVSLHYSPLSCGLQQAEKRVNHYLPINSQPPLDSLTQAQRGGGSWPDGDRLCPASLCRPSRGRSLFGGLSTPFGCSVSPLLFPSASYHCYQALPTSHLCSVFGKLTAGSRTTNSLCLEPDRNGVSFPQPLPKVLAEWPKGDRASGHN